MSSNATLPGPSATSAWAVLRERARQMLADGASVDEVFAETSVPRTELAVMARLEQFPPTGPGAAETRTSQTADAAPDAAEPVGQQAQDRDPGPLLEPAVRHARHTQVDADPVPVPKEPARASDEDAARPGVDTLLKQADASAQPKARQLAARIRAQAEELRDLLAHEQDVAEAQAAVERLEAQLVAARAKLRAAKTPPRPAAGRPPTAEPTGGAPAPDCATTDAPAPTGPDGELDMAAARTWLRNNGFTVADRGRLPSFALNAYLRAQRIAAEGPEENEDTDADA